MSLLNRADRRFMTTPNESRYSMEDKYEGIERKDHGYIPR